VTSDGELFRRSARDPEVFEGIFERHAASVWSYVRRRIGADAAEDVVADAFLIAFTRRASFDPSYGSARPWLLGIATNLIRHRLREERVHLAAIGRLSEPAPLDDLDLSRFDAERLKPLLAEALMALANDDRETSCSSRWESSRMPRRRSRWACRSAPFARGCTGFGGPSANASPGSRQ
jgi:RNA polymerase sigma factor (sigma-70 family)